MLSAWPSRGRQRLGHLELPAGWLPAAVLTFLLVICIANSTVLAAWVPGSTVVTRAALAAALLMTALALLRFIPWPLALAIGLGAAPFAAYAFAGPTLAAAHPADRVSFDLLGVWAGRIASGEAGADVSFFLYLLCLLFWIVGGWLAWCVMRWRQPLLGLVPGAAAFATNLLNYPTDQNGYVVAFMALTLGLLLWTSFHRSVEGAHRAKVKVSSDARWDFWETGAVILASVVIVGLFLPPISRVDSTVDIENGVFRGWAEMNQRMNHPVAFGRGGSAGTSIGFADNVPLGGPIHKTGGVVLTYTIDGQNFAGVRYFRGLDLSQTRNGVWQYDKDAVARLSVPHDQSLAFGESYTSFGEGTLHVQMLKPPEKATDALFYPGTLLKTDRDTIVFSSLGTGPGVPPGTVDHLYTVDRVSGASRAGGAGPYKVTVQFPLATDSQLKAASTDYPAWVQPYRNFSASYQAPGAAGPAALGGCAAGYRSVAACNRIHQLALQVTAGLNNPYDQAGAIESFLRGGFSYTLNPPLPPSGTDPIDYFLFTTKQGYCEYFATAMGDMLRSLGVPTRLVNGYGPGVYDDHLSKYVVRESDAHTWVELYVPNYGWIPFEPTPDGSYFPIPRGVEGSNCAKDSEICVDPNAIVNPDPANTKPVPDKGAFDSGDPTGGAGRTLGLRIPVGVPIGLAVLLVIGAAAFVAGSRYLRPRTVAGVWNRTLLLTRAAGLRGPPGETPTEFGRRLGDEFPETAPHARELAGDFVIAAYAPVALARARRVSVLASWEALRPLLVRRLMNRLRIA